MGDDSDALAAIKEWRYAIQRFAFEANRQWDAPSPHYLGNLSLMDIGDDGPAATDTGALRTGGWMVDTLRGIKRFGADNKELDARAHVCDGGIEQVERHVLEKHCEVRIMEEE